MPEVMLGSTLVGITFCSAAGLTRKWRDCDTDPNLKKAHSSPPRMAALLLSQSTDLADFFAHLLTSGSAHSTAWQAFWWEKPERRSTLVPSLYKGLQIHDS